MNVLLTIISLVAFASQAHSQNRVKESYENNLKLSVEFIKNDKKCPYDRIQLFIANQSPDQAYKIIEPKDGSESSWREPYIYFIAEQNTLNNKWVKVEKQKTERCGLFDAEWQDDTITIKQGQNIKIYEMAFNNIISEFEISSKAQVRIIAHYKFKNGLHPKEHINEIPKDLHPIIEQQFNNPVISIPIFELFSDPFELNGYGQTETKKIEAANKTKKSTIKEGWPKDVQGLINHLNTWNKNQLDAYERPEVYPNLITSGETNGWVSEHKRKLKELGATIFWNKEKKEYELN